MFKKFISMAAATIFLIAGLSVVAISPASAVGHSCVGYFSMTSTTTYGSLSDTSVTLDFSVLAANCPQETSWDLQVRDRSVTPNVLLQTIPVTSSNTRVTVTGLVANKLHNFFFLPHGKDGGPEPGLNLTTLTSGSTPTAPLASSSSSSSSSQQNAQEVAATFSTGAGYVMGAVAKGKAALSSQFKNNSSATLQQFSDAGYGVRNSAVAEKVSAAILKLPVADREKSEKINEIINLENFIDRVAVLGTRTSVTSNDLVSRGLLPSDSVHKYSVVQGLANYPDGSLNSMAKIEAAIKAEIVKAEARKAKTEAIKAKIAARRG